MPRILLFLLFMTLGTGLAYLLLVQEEVRDEAELVGEVPVDQMLLKGVVMEHLEGERLAWRIEAAEALHNDRGDSTVLSGVTFDVFRAPDAGAGSPGAAPALHGTARRAVLSGSPRRVLLTGNVVMSRGADTVLRSERVSYDHGAQRIQAPQAFELRTGRTLQTGVALDYDLVTETATFRSPRILYRHADG